MNEVSLIKKPVWESGARYILLIPNINLKKKHLGLVARSKSYESTMHVWQIKNVTLNFEVMISNNVLLCGLDML